jgi:hypothetical protein
MAVPVRKSRTTSCWPIQQDGLQPHHDRYHKGDIYLMTQHEVAQENGDVTVLRLVANTKQIDTNHSKGNATSETIFGNACMCL